MVCSACAFESPAGMRFCGMCGMPLPQKPLTAPGAHSTLNFTRVPVDSRALGERSTSQPGGAVVLEMPGAPINGGPVSDLPPVAPVEQAQPPAPPKELVPDVPLDQYVESFRYEPPQDPAEVTMRGDAHLATPDVPAPVPADVPLPEVPITRGDNIVASSSAAEVKPPRDPIASTAEDVDTRLGLEPETPTEARIARPRFLDINEPAKETNAGPPSESQPVAGSGTTISGPSFLGLSDRPQTWAAAVGVKDGDYAPRNYHWRLWFVAAVLLVFGWLGVLEYRAQVHQTDNGPVEVIKTKLRKIGQGAMSQIAGDANPSNNDGSKPEMQVQEQQPAQAPQQSKPNNATATPGSGSSAAATTPSTVQPSTTSDAPSTQSRTASTTTPSASASTSGAAAAPDVTAKKPANESSAQPAAEKRQSDKSSDSDASASAKAAPGEDEMAKAKNASDAAAEAAWLWKATAKGNPDAPVQLADMYVKGAGVPRSCEQAVVLLKTAAAKENARARNRLASMYATGTCVQRNRVEAYRWLSSALTADPGSEWAQQNRDLIWQQMTPDERAAAQKYR